MEGLAWPVSGWDVENAEFDCRQCDGQYRKGNSGCQLHSRQSCPKTGSSQQLDARPSPGWAGQSHVVPALDGRLGWLLEIERDRLALFPSAQLLSGVVLGGFAESLQNCDNPFLLVGWKFAYFRQDRPELGFGISPNEIRWLALQGVGQHLKSRLGVADKAAFEL